MEVESEEEEKKNYNKLPLAQSPINVNSFRLTSWNFSHNVFCPRSLPIKKFLFWMRRKSSQVYAEQSCDSSLQWNTDSIWFRCAFVIFYVNFRWHFVSRAEATKWVALRFELWYTILDATSLLRTIDAMRNAQLWLQIIERQLSNDFENLVLYVSSLLDQLLPYHPYHALPYNYVGVANTA